MSGIWPELSAALAAATPEQDRHLLALGIPDDTRLICGTVRAIVDGATYQADPTGNPIIVVPAIEGEVIDLVGFHTFAPDTTWTRLGIANYLGADGIFDLVAGEPMLVYSNPIQWLCASTPANGCVILNWQAAARDIPPVPIIADCVALAEKLDRCLSIAAHVPDIRVPRAA